MTQFVLQQKKQVIEDVSAFMQSLRKENIAQNKMLSQLEKRLKESTVFEQSKDQIIHSCQAEINKWSVGFEAKFPMISKTELKICFYTLKGFSNKEIASILFTTTKNIEQTKYRIKKKLTFDTTQSLEVFLKAMI
jgi:DNA-binding CsgD family transcriptional regulator